MKTLEDFISLLRFNFIEIPLTPQTECIQLEIIESMYKKKIVNVNCIETLFAFYVVKISTIQQNCDQILP